MIMDEGGGYTCWVGAKVDMISAKKLCYCFSSSVWRVVIIVFIKCIIMCITHNIFTIIIIFSYLFCLSTDCQHHYYIFFFHFHAPILVYNTDKLMLSNTNKETISSIKHILWAKRANHTFGNYIYDVCHDYFFLLLNPERYLAACFIFCTRHNVIIMYL